MPKREHFRPSRSHIMKTQGAASKLSSLRQQYEQMGPSHPMFEHTLAQAALAGGRVETGARQMGPVDGRSRRAAAERFVIGSVLAGAFEADIPPTWQEPPAQTVVDILAGNPAEDPMSEM